MPYKPNTYSNDYPEYNDRTDAQNGQAGSMTQQSLQNANVQKGAGPSPGGSNPYAGFQNTAAQWQQMQQPAPQRVQQPQQPPAQRYDAMALLGIGNAKPQQQALQAQQPSPWSTPLQNQRLYNNTYDDSDVGSEEWWARRGFGQRGQQPQPNPNPQPPPVPDEPPPQTTQPGMPGPNTRPPQQGTPGPNTGTNPQAPRGATGPNAQRYNDLALRYSRTPGYEWLKDRGDLVQKYQEWAYDQTVSEGVRRARQGIHITQWLAENGYSANTPEGSDTPWAGPNEAPPPPSGTPVEPQSTDWRDYDPARPTRERPNFDGEPSPFGSKYLDDLLAKLTASNEIARSEGERAVRAAGAQYDQQDTGAFLDSLGTMNRDLSAQLGKDRSEVIYAGSEAEQNRMLQDIMSRRQAQTQMYGFELGLDGQMYSSDRDFQGRLAGIDQNDRQAVLNYNLGLLNSATQLYGIDSQERVALMRLAQDLGPEEFIQRLLAWLNGDRVIVETD